MANADRGSRAIRPYKTKEENMRNRTTCGIAALTLTGILACGLVFAARGSSNKQWDPAARLQMMTQELSLTGDQQTQIKKIMDDNKGGNKEMRQKSDEQIMAVLNDDQKKKYQDMKAKMKANFKGKRNNQHAEGSGTNK